MIMGHKHKETQYYEGDLKGVFDTHAHLYDERIEPSECLLRAESAGVDKILVPADNLESSHKAVDFATRYNSDKVAIWAAVGVHPHEASGYNANVEAELFKMLGDRKALRIAALGEIGLDYYYDLSPRDVQKDVFRRQLEISKEADIPFILHERDATGECLQILEDAHKSGMLRKNPGVCHCCGMSVESAQIMLKMGFYIGFDGPLTYKNNRRGIELIKACPADRIVVETDTPYLTYVIEKIALERGESVSDVAKYTSDNGMALYEL